MESLWDVAQHLAFSQICFTVRFGTRLIKFQCRRQFNFFLLSTGIQTLSTNMKTNPICLHASACMLTLEPGKFERITAINPVGQTDCTRKFKNIIKIFNHH